MKKKTPLSKIGKDLKQAAEEVFAAPLFEMKDSGVREEFATGAVRDTQEGKGRYDLISPFALKRLAIVYQKGAQKYSNRNWEAGMPHCRYYDSAIRHLGQWLMGDTDEDHLAHAMWNVAAIMHMQETHPELDDRPNWKRDTDGSGNRPV